MTEAADNSPPRRARPARATPRRLPHGGGGIGRGADQDLPLKIEMRRLLWRMGCSARLDVRLRAYVPPAAGKAPAQDLTDLDVLGIAFTAAAQLHTTFADCRSSEGKALERMFWVRGVADFVAADDAYLVRAHAVPPAARALASRLGIGVLTPDDLAAMETTFPTDLPLADGALSLLFDREAVARHLDAHNDADPKLAKLLGYLEFDYWIYEPHRNMTQLIAHLAGAVSTLDPTNRRHRTLLYDCAWHYALAAARAAGFVRSTRMAAVPVAVELYVGGGELALREKAALAKALAAAGLPVDAGMVLPPYMEPMTQLVNRYLVRPTEIAEVLRYAEYLAVTEVNREEATVAAAFGSHVRPVAAKLLADTCGFLVSAAGLRPDFRAHARERLVVDLTGGAPAAASEVTARVARRADSESPGSTGEVAPARQESSASAAGSTPAQEPLPLGEDDAGPAVG